MKMYWPSERKIEFYAKNPNLKDGIAVSLINDKEKEKGRKEKDR